MGWIQKIQKGMTGTLARYIAVTICVSLFGFELIDLKVCQVLLRDTCT